jgi:hypothetical protein
MAQQGQLVVVESEVELKERTEAETGIWSQPKLEGPVCDDTFGDATKLTLERGLQPETVMISAQPGVEGWWPRRGPTLRHAITSLT